MNKKEHVLGQVTDLLAKMEKIQFPATGQLVATRFLLDTLIVDGDNACYNVILATAPYPARYINPPIDGHPANNIRSIG